MAKTVTLNLIVDKSCNRVRFAESDEHFVDILLSFLTLPLSSMLRLTKQSIGSMNNLRESVENLNSKFFRSEPCKSMLLFPSNAASGLFSSLPIKFDNTSIPSFCYTSRRCTNSCLSFYANALCPCGSLLNEKLEFVADAGYSSAFFHGAFKFTISEGLLVSPFSAEFAIEQLSKLDIKQRSFLESVSVDVTAEKIIELLKRMLVSDTPLTDVFLGDNKENDKVQVMDQPLPAKCDEKKAPTTSTRKISMKLYVNREEDRVLFAEADTDFVDLVFGFLTYPMGFVANKFGGQTGIRCMDNLYNSVEALKSANYFKNDELIRMLLNPKVPRYFKVTNQLIDLEEETQINYCVTCQGSRCQNSYKARYNRHVCLECLEGKYRLLCIIDPKRGYNDNHSRGGYMRISRYMVTDDLVIKQSSSSMVLTAILKETAEKEIHARNVEIWEQEALALLRASITSENVLTDALLGDEKREARLQK